MRWTFARWCKTIKTTRSRLNLSGEPTKVLPLSHKSLLFLRFLTAWTPIRRFQIMISSRSSARFPLFTRDKNDQHLCGNRSQLRSRQTGSVFCCVRGPSDQVRPGETRSPQSTPGAGYRISGRARARGAGQIDINPSRLGVGEQLAR